jgi:protein-S-isoprenylcysteine O-methyltransferase Ste14
MNQNTSTKISSFAMYLFAVAGLVFLIMTKHLFAAHPAGMIIQVLAAGLMIWARITFGFRSFHALANTTKGSLVTNGPYRWLRHPVYVSVIYFVWAGALSSPHLYAMAATVFISASLIARMLLEEKLLKQDYPEYTAYSEHTFLIIPFLL